jgi:ABC-type glycerol-3-phosphate transport system permease component
LKPQNTTAKIAVQIALSVLSVLFFLLWMITTSLKPIGETMTTPPRWIPSQILWSNYPKAIFYDSKELGYVPFFVYAVNTVVLTGLVVAGTVF